MTSPDQDHVIGDDLPTELFQFYGIRELLVACIINNDFRVTDDLIEPIVLSDPGESVRRDLRYRDKRIRPNEAKLAVALEFGRGDDIFVDPSTDITSLRDAVGAAVRKRKLLFPFIFGRELHDAARDKYGDKGKLTLPQTLSILAGQPIGTFQYGDTVVGPYGCFQSRQSRMLPAQRAFPGYLCRDERCSKIHWIQLSTSDSSAIYRANHRMEELMRKREHGPSVMPAKFIEQMLAYMGFYDVETADGLIDLVADAFTIEECRSVAEACMRRECSQPGGKVALQKSLSIVFGNPAEFVATLGRSELLCMLLYFTDRDIISAIDSALANGRLRLAPGEVRQARISRFPKDPAVRMQVGELGVRTSTTGRSAAPQRLANLVRLAVGSGAVDVADIAFSLGMAENAQVEEVAAYAYAHADDPEVLERGLLATRSAAAVVAHQLVLDEHANDRDQLRRRVRWRLGLTPESSRNDLWETARDQLQTMEASVGAQAGESVTRGDIANCFVAVEELLYKSLEFSVWALTIDHYLQSEPFGYRPNHLEVDIDSFLDLSGKQGDSALWSRMDKPVLAELGAAFGRFSKRLRVIAPSSLKRPIAQYPRTVVHSGRPFAFPYTLPYLNLLPPARDAIADALSAISRIALDDAVLGVRNAGLHGNTEFPSRAQLERCAQQLHTMFDLLGSSGLCPRLYARTGSTVDAFGRQTISYRDGDVQVDVPLGTWMTATKLPSNAERLVIARAATLPEVGPLRFSVMPSRGPEDYWDGWPARWSRDSGYEATPGSPGLAAEDASLAG